MTRSVSLHDLHQDYSRLAADYDTRWRRFNAIAYNWVLARLYVPGRVLDLGCGTGTLLYRISEKFPDAALSGVDANADMLARARERVPQAALKEADIECIAGVAGEGPFDTVLSINVLHHLNDPAGHIGSLRRLCTAGGAVFLCDFAIDTPLLRFMEKYWSLFYPAHHGAFERKKLRAMIEQEFRIEDEALLQPDRFWRLQIYKLGL